MSLVPRIGLEVGRWCMRKGLSLGDKVRMSPVPRKGFYGGQGSTRQDLPCGDEDVPHAWHGSPRGEVMLAEALCPRGKTSPAICAPGHAGAEGGPTAGPRGVREVAPRGRKRALRRRRATAGHRLRDSAVTHKVESTTKQHCRV